MTVAQSPRMSGPYTATAGQTVLDYDFPIDHASEIVALRLRGTTEIPLELDVDYGVTGVGAASGTIILTAGALEGDVFTLYGRLPIERVTNFSGFRSIPNNTINTELDRMTKSLQEMRRDVDGAIHTAQAGAAYDVQGRRIINVANGVDDSDAATVGQLKPFADAAQAAAATAVDAANEASAAYRDFDKRYLGAKELPPDFDNHGEALEAGALYFDLLLGSFRVFDLGEWRAFSAVNDGSVVPSSLDASKAAGFRAVIKGDTFINVKDHFGVKGGNDAGDWAKIQAALDAEPKGDILFFPAGSYVGTVPLVMSKHKSLKLDPNAVLTLSSAVSSDDLLRIAVTNPASSDVRNMIIEGGTWIADARANCAINVNPANSTPGQNPHFETHIRNAMITGGLCAIRIGGATPAGDSNFNTIEGNNLAIQRSGGLVVNLDGCADGHRILNNLMFGPGTGVRLNLVLGAYQTLISGNCIVTRDGALLVTNGSNWHFERNQVEQHGGTNLLGQHIQVQGLAYPAKHWRIVGNNFGGGADVNYAIWLINSIAGLIDENQMQLCVVADVGLIDGGGGALPKYNTIGARNTFRGARSIRSNLTDASRRMILDVSPGTESNKGIWRTASGFTNSNGWTQSNLRRIVDEYGILHWEGALNGGTLTAGTVIWAAQMPAWERPVDTAACVSVATGSGAGALNFGTNGDMAVISAPNAAVYLSGVSYPVKWWDTYDAMP